MHNESCTNFTNIGPFPFNIAAHKTEVSVLRAAWIRAQIDAQLHEASSDMSYWYDSSGG